MNTEINKYKWRTTIISNHNELNVLSNQLEDIISKIENFELSVEFKHEELISSNDDQLDI
jgi:hypothetical protein